MTAIEQAIAFAGGQAELGEMLEPPVTQQAVAKWKADGFCPITRAIEIAKTFDELRIEDLVSPKLQEALRNGK